jgi:hypothetical protein
LFEKLNKKINVCGEHFRQVDVVWKLS